MYNCDVCSYKSNRHYNLIRHINLAHGIEEDTHSESEVESNMSDEGNHTDESMYSNDESNDSNTTEVGTDESTDEENSQESPWDAIVTRPFKELQSEYTQKVENFLEAGKNPEKARLAGYKEMYEPYRDQMRHHYLGAVFWHQDLWKDPVHRKIKDTAKRLRDKEDYDTKESWQYAVKKRQYLFDDVLNSYNTPPTEDSHDSMYI